MKFAKVIHIDSEYNFHILLNIFQLPYVVFIVLLILTIIFILYLLNERKKLLKLTTHHKQEQKHFQDIVESIDAVSWQANLETLQFTYISPQAKRLFGYPLRQWTEEPNFWKNQIHPEDYKSVFDNFRKFTKQKLAYQQEYRIKTKAGNFIWVKNFIEVKYQEDGSDKLVGLFINISRQKAQEQVLHKMRKQISQAHTIIENAQDAMMIKDVEGRYQFVNKATERLFGIPKRKIVDRKDEDILGVQNSQKIRNTEKEVLNTNQIITKEEELIINNRQFFFETSYAPLWVQNQLVGLISISRDITERKKTERKILESEERFRRYFKEEKSVKLLINSESGYIIDANLSAELFYGYDYKTLTNLNITDINTLSSERIKEEMDKARTRNKNYFNFQHRLANGLIRHVEVYSTPISINQQKYLLSTIYDVTERIKTELALKDSEERYRLLTESSPMGILVHSQGKVKYANPHALKVLEASKLDEIINSPIKDLIHPEFQEQVLERMKQLYHSDIQVAHPIDEKFITLKGNVKDILVSGILIKYEGKTSICNVFHDISERKQAEQELLQTKTLLQEAEQIAKIGSWTYDLQKGDIWWSEGLYDVFGQSEEKGIPMSKYSHQHPWQENIHPQDRLQAIKALYKSLETGEYQCEYRFYRYDTQEIIYIYSEADVEFDMYQNPVRIMGIVQDISDRKRAEMSLIKNKNQLEKANQELEELNYIASHDLKAPVANMQGLLELYQLIPAEEQSGIISKMEKTVTKMKATLNNLNEVISLKKDLSKTNKTIYFEEILHQIIASIDTQIKTTDAQIVSDFSRCLSIIYPPVQLESILQNLLTNAIKYCNPNRKPEIFITTDKTNEGICLTFSDNGLGMDLDKMGDKLFKIFQRFHNHVEGKGIGLYIINQIVQSHGGQVKVESEVNQGTTFNIILKNE